MILIDLHFTCDDVRVFQDLQLSETEIAWLAGLLEGEGSFTIDSRAKKRYNNSTSPPSCTLRVSMTDKDVIAKVAKMFKKDLFQATRKTTGGKPEYIFSCQARPPLIYLLPRLLPHLGDRRSKQVQACLEVLEEWLDWYLDGGLSKAAKEGYNKGLCKKK